MELTRPAPVQGFLKYIASDESSGPSVQILIEYVRQSQFYLHDANPAAIRGSDTEYAYHQSTPVRAILLNSLREEDISKTLVATSFVNFTHRLFHFFFFVRIALRQGNWTPLGRPGFEQSYALLVRYVEGPHVAGTGTAIRILDLLGKLRDRALSI